MQELKYLVVFNNNASNLIEIYLQNNCLKRIASEICNVPQISVLSVRNNELETLPHEIYKLSKLKELSVGGNMLRYLPGEILELELESVFLTPNPWMNGPEIEEFNGQNKFSIPSMKEMAARSVLSKENATTEIRPQGFCSKCKMSIQQPAIKEIRIGSILSHSVPLLFNFCSQKCSLQNEACGSQTSKQ